MDDEVRSAAVGHVNIKAIGVFIFEMVLNGWREWRAFKRSWPLRKFDELGGSSVHVENRHGAGTRRRWWRFIDVVNDLREKLLRREPNKKNHAKHGKAARDHVGGIETRGFDPARRSIDPSFRNSAARP